MNSYIIRTMRFDIYYRFVYLSCNKHPRTGELLQDNIHTYLVYMLHVCPLTCLSAYMEHLSMPARI